MGLLDNISDNETLARIICGSSQPKKNKYKVYYCKSNKKYMVQVGVFLDSRYPTKISVNRTSTITEDETHSLGLEHRNEKCPELTYLGYAQVDAEFCRVNCECDIKKEDYHGRKPYHANIVYPKEQSKEDDQSIAIKLAFHARFYLYSLSKLCIPSL